VIAWVIRKARRLGGRLDAEADRVIDASLDRLHEVVSAKLAAIRCWLSSLRKRRLSVTAGSAI
jgi:hypothetical protein